METGRASVGFRFISGYSPGAFPVVFHFDRTPSLPIPVVGKLPPSSCRALALVQITASALSDIFCYSFTANLHDSFVFFFFILGRVSCVIFL
jgi:hypothetical protein